MEVKVLMGPDKHSKFLMKYRLISLLTTMGKLNEKVILIKFQEQVEEPKLIPDEHSVDGRSGTSPCEQVSGSFNKKESTGAIFFDVYKAFDKVWHDGLLNKLLEAKIHPGWKA